MHIRDNCEADTHIVSVEIGQNGTGNPVIEVCVHTDGTTQTSRFDRELAGRLSEALSRTVEVWDNDPDMAAWTKFQKLCRTVGARYFYADWLRTWKIMFKGMQSEELGGLADGPTTAYKAAYKALVDYLQSEEV